MTTLRHTGLENRSHAARDLSKAMDFDHVIRVHPDGRVTDAEPGHWAPAVTHEDTCNDMSALDDYRPWGDWNLMHGYTGQYGYNGPVMHASEYIGGRMARDILASPGLYVCVVVEVLDCEYCADWEPADDDDMPACNSDHEPAGWAVAYITDDGAHPGTDD